MSNEKCPNSQSSCSRENAFSLSNALPAFVSNRARSPTAIRHSKLFSGEGYNWLSKKANVLNRADQFNTCCFMLYRSEKGKDTNWRLAMPVSLVRNLLLLHRIHCR